jgi:cell division protein FtsW (lipid II flippase)
MPIDFSAEYSQRSSDELLHLASARHSLTTDAAAALDAELRRRNLTESDRVEHQKFVKRQERREGRKRRWKIPGLKDQLTWRDILEALAVMAFILAAYFALPSRYHLKPDWQEAAVIVMITSVMVIFAARSWRKITFWMSLGISSAIHLALVHAGTRRIPSLSRNQGRGAAFLGFVLFLAVYGAVRFLQRMLYGKESPDGAYRQSVLSSWQKFC